MIPNKYFKSTERNIGNNNLAQTDRATEYEFILYNASPPPQQNDRNSLWQKIGFSSRPAVIPPSDIMKHKKTSVNIIDTPGLNDTKGLEQDEKNMQIILNSAINANELSAIVLIMNGTSARITTNIKNMLAKFRGSVPDSINNNVIVIFTMCREDTCNFKDFDELGISKDKVFYINNTAFSSDPKTLSGSSRALQELEWTESMKICGEIVDAVTKLSPISTNEFTQIRKIRNNLKNYLHNARLKINELYKLQENIEQAKLITPQLQAEVDKHKNFTTKKQIVQTQLVTAPYHSTLCSNCNTICHDEETHRQGARIFDNCSCMNHNGYCKKCPKKCSARNHYHARQTIKYVTVDVDEILKDVQDKYQQSMTALNKTTQNLTQYELTKNSIQFSIDKMAQDIEKECITLKSICKKFNFVDELNILVTQLKQEPQMIQCLQTRQTADIFIENIEYIIRKLNDIDQKEKKGWFTLDHV